MQSAHGFTAKVCRHGAYECSALLPSYAPA